jgi:hypothetical protein
MRAPMRPVRTFLTGELINSRKVLVVEMFGFAITLSAMRHRAGAFSHGVAFILVKVKMNILSVIRR